MQAIHIENLSKRYTSGKLALNKAGLSLGEGEVFGFLGPNGAGKTTTIKLLGGTLLPTEGKCEVFGLNPFEKPEEIHRISGLLTEHAQMYNPLSGYENLIFYGRLFDLSASDSKTRAVELLDLLGLNESKDRKLGAYSTGMRQRLSLARTMIHRPRLLFLDEPTSGLDPENALSVNEIIKEQAKENGTTVFLCTHQLRYAQDVCSSFGLIDDGTLFATGTLEKLRELVQEDVSVMIEASQIPDRIQAERIGERTFDVRVKEEEDIAEIVKQIVSDGGKVYQVSTKILTLEEIYFALLKKHQRGELLL
ncbi:MAG: ABC transporter ATP-binding protein [Lachnospiraceae bacterium]|nr:ABC transporter ATP-binding protein [Lachnospiraceae bacterium]